MRYRTFGEPDYAALQALDAAALRHADPAFETLPERERDGRAHTSLAALKFYERSEHSFVAEDDSGLRGFVFAQHVWQGDRPIVLIRTVSLAPDAPDGTAGGLFQAVVKSAYDSAVYELHFPVTPALHAKAREEGTVSPGPYGICHLGSRTETAPGPRVGSPA
ncbi:hypothetical protein HNQ07_003748 [Deinococcus metalli]|uniref:GNAT family acetyltransferase n=1 Tax=Deinococcus metalli TaxID=1141878 RepID=A0A7W8NTJ7_9DEIO|nr:DUF1999 domain-containing protein [Deinococcus metalli]MBB5378247.1 hypothetical protein [Deinococcus metalli]GHF57137.1 GNAT family acetyltransferase [Deinococcus metalli]